MFYVQFQGVIFVCTSTFVHMLVHYLHNYFERNVVMLLMFYA